MALNIRKLEDFGEFAREALEENKVDEVKLNSMSRREILDMVLTYHGIMGYTADIIGIFDDLGCVDGEDWS